MYGAAGSATAASSLTGVTPSFSFTPPRISSSSTGEPPEAWTLAGSSS